MLRRWRRASLRAHLIVQMCLALGIVIIAFYLTTDQAVRSSTYDALQDRSVLAQLMADRMDAQLDHAAMMLGAAVKSPELQLEDGDLEPEKALLARAYDESGVFQRVSLLDASGQILWLQPYDASRIGSSLSSPPFAGDSGASANPVIMPRVGAADQPPAIAIYVPIRGSKGGTAGYLCGWIDLNSARAQSLLYPFTAGSAGYTDVVDGAGRVLASTDRGRINQTSDHAGVFGTLIKNADSSVGSCHSCHANQASSRQNDVLAFAPLHDLPWGIALHQPESEVFASTRALNGRLVLLALVILAVVIAVTWFSTSAIVQPLSHLNLACRQIAGGDLSHPVPLMGGGEFSTLAQSFEAMRSDLADSRQHMVDAQQELESRVQQRTVELVQARDHLLKTNRDLSALNAVAAILGNSLNLSDTIDAALERSAEAVAAVSGGIFLYQADGSAQLAACLGLQDASCERLQHISLPPLPADGDGQAWEDTCRDVVSANLGMASVLCVSLAIKKVALGCLFVAHEKPGYFSEKDQMLLSSVGWQLAAAVRNIRLYEALQHEEKARGKLLRQVIVAQEDERRRIARELHDETSQYVTALLMGLDSARLAMTTDAHSAETHLQATRSIATGMLAGIHRLVADLRPSLLDDLGLVPAIAWYGEKRLNPLGIECHFDTNLQAERLSPPVETTLFRIVQEAMTNVVRHAQATSVWVSLRALDGHIMLVVEDNGKGFKLQPDGVATSDEQGVGLRGMQERAAILGGDIDIHSRPGEGTRIAVTIPNPADGVSAAEVVDSSPIQTMET